jgi:energy-coupling factor transporter ATP-binding protein EcfA2
MLRSLTLRNFKLFDPAGASIQPARITVLIGPNRSGKSTIFQALLLLKQSLGPGESADIKWTGPYFGGGSFYELVHPGGQRLPIGIQLVVQPYVDDGPEKTRLHLPTGPFEYAANLCADGLESHIGRIESPGNPLIGEWSRTGTGSVNRSVINVEDVAQFNLEASGAVAAPIRLAGAGIYQQQAYLK